MKDLDVIAYSVDATCAQVIDLKTSSEICVVSHYENEKIPYQERLELIISAINSGAEITRTEQRLDIAVALLDKRALAEYADQCAKLGL